jgi:6,7-dimethyl-8-ribityllumazine synthase
VLKSLHIGRYATTPQDFRTLVKFFEAIGFERVAAQNDADRHSAILSSPLALLSVNALAPQYPAEVVERLKDVAKLLVVEVTNPDDAFSIAQQMDLKVISDSGWSTGQRSFLVELPGEIMVSVRGKPEPPPDGTDGELDASGKRFAVVVSRFNSFITERLLAGTLDGLRRMGATDGQIHIFRVPGSFEIPSAARTLAETRKYDAIICLGCLLRGDTAHYDVIVNEVTRGIGQSAQETGVPHAFGILTCDTLEQAIDRAGLKMGNKGFEAALAAVEMANLKKAVVGRSSSVVRKNKRAASRQRSLSRKRQAASKVQKTRPSGGSRKRH